jgi:ribosomal protein L25 (general stress protein Ctc)
MEEIRLKAEKRVQGGKNPARRLRKEGIIPAVLYGKDVEPLPLSISAKEWRSAQGHVRVTPSSRWNWKIMARPKKGP